MSEQKSKSGAELFIVDNSDDDWKVRDYLKEWAEISHQFDIATGYFEIGALLALDGKWQQLDKMRILMGDEMTQRTKKAFVDALKSSIENRLDDSIENEKEKNEFLKGVPAIVQALATKKIECRVYTKKKFHAKAYITKSKLTVVGPAALVGSSNFTFPGLTDNVELNIHEKQRVKELQQWYERHWMEAEDVTPEILRVIERHTRDYQPFEIYAKALHEYFRGAEMTVGEWELRESRIYKILDGYQREGYRHLMKIASEYTGAFLCDGVGLGKTFIGLMLIERLVERDRKRVALVVPKSARVPVWERTIDEYLPHLHGVFSNLIIFNHTDLNRESKAKDFERVKEMADVILVDEAHHFRNRTSRYQKLFELAEGKQLFLLTATPINNHLSDFQHMIELFSRRQLDYFKNKLGIHSIPSYFREKEKALEQLVRERLSADANSGETLPDEIETNAVEAEQVLVNDKLFNALVVQRSRSYVRESQIKEGAALTLFPQKQPPQIAEYSVKKTYGRLLGVLDKAFARKSPLFSLAIYHPEMYSIGEQDTKLNNRQKQVVALIRTNFLKRFESSTYAFQKSCEKLLAKLLAFIEKNGNRAEQSRLERWKAQKNERLGFMRVNIQPDLFTNQGDLGETEDDEDFDNLITDEILEATAELDRDQYKVDEIINETFLDLDQIVDFLDELHKFKPSNDDKLRALIRLLKTDAILKTNKVLIFTEFKDTAEYLLEQLQAAGIAGAAKIDSGTKEERGKLIERFAPYYNGTSSANLANDDREEIRVLISTDVLSEGLNLQDATRLINYDLHWNPVRLMQRIGRIDRRMNPQVETRLIADHPEQKRLRGKVAYWNFLPPDELDDLLKLYNRVARKTLRISRTFGIEGRKLLKPDDDFEDLRDFLHAYEGERTTVEELRLEYKELLKDEGLAARLERLPQKVFSGKAHPSPDARAVFFCYRLPVQLSEKDEDAAAWSTAEGKTAWYLYDLQSEQIEDEPSVIVNLIRCTPDTPRQRALTDDTLAEIRAKVEKYVKNSYLKKVQAPVGIKPVLKAWMEIA
ncbi:MAG: helicase-related protein [Acidobacteriota bacterium]